VKRISIIGVVVGIIVLVISIAIGVEWLDAIVFGIGSIVAIVPEGLQLTVTVFSAPIASLSSLLYTTLSVLGCSTAANSIVTERGRIN
jgi:hypothetical protein